MREHAAITFVSQVGQVFDDAGDIAVLAFDGIELELLIESQLALKSRIDAQLAESLDQARAVDRPGAVAAPNMAFWLRGRFGLTPQDASSLVRQTNGLRAAPVAAEAARFGAIPVRAAAEIGHAVTALPDQLGPDLRAEGADLLLGYAVGRDGPALDAREIRLVGRYLHEVLDPDAADQLLAARLEHDEARAWQRRFLSITDDHDSGIRLRGLLTTVAGATLRAVLDPRRRPRPNHQHHTRELLHPSPD